MSIFWPQTLLEVQQFLLQIMSQLQTLEKEGTGLFALTLAQIQCQRRGEYVLTNLHLTRGQIFMNKDMLLTHRLKLNPPIFLAPELNEVLVLPKRISVSAAYYSLGLLCQHFLVTAGLSLNHGNCKLAYCLERCLDPDPLKRTLLWL
jgi:hypothetical protein